MVFHIVLSLLIFVVILSWTDLKSHVGYAYNISYHEGWWKFPLIWIQSFIIPSVFLDSGKSGYHYKELTDLERKMRMCLSGEISGQSSVRDNVYYLNQLYFKLSKKVVEINGYDRLLPPRLAFMMIECKKRINRAQTIKKESIFD